MFLYTIYNCSFCYCYFIKTTFIIITLFLNYLIIKNIIIISPSKCNGSRIDVSCSIKIIILLLLLYCYYYTTTTNNNDYKKLSLILILLLLLLYYYK